MFCKFEIGSVIFVVCCFIGCWNILLDTQENADRAAKMVAVQYSSEDKPLLTIADAIKANSYYPYPGEGNVLTVGDANGTYKIMS